MTAPTNEVRATARRQWPQYFYLYGSALTNMQNPGEAEEEAEETTISTTTTVRSENEEEVGNLSLPPPPPSQPHSPAGTDQDSLVGESLILTDTEDDTAGSSTSVSPRRHGPPPGQRATSVGPSNGALPRPQKSGRALPSYQHQDMRNSFLSTPSTSSDSSGAKTKAALDGHPPQTSKSRVFVNGDDRNHRQQEQSQADDIDDCEAAPLLLAKQQEPGDGDEGPLRQLLIARCCSVWRIVRHHPIAFWWIWTFGLVLLTLLSLALIRLAGGRQGLGRWTSRYHSSLDGDELVGFHVPFPRVDRADYGDPVSRMINIHLIHPSLHGSSKRSSGEGTFVFPFPTGAFWTNLVVIPTTADHGLSFPIAVYPYAYKWNDNLLQVSYPASHRREDAVSIHDDFFPDLTLGCSDSVDSRHVVAFDPLSVTLRFQTGGGSENDNNKRKKKEKENNSWWETYLVQGSPYVTVKYNGVSPSIRALSLFHHVACPGDDAINDNSTNYLDWNAWQDNLGNRRRRDVKRRLKYGVCYVDQEQSNDQQTLLTGVQFILQTQEGQNWLIFASEPLTLLFDNRVRTTVVVQGSFSGVLRLAVVPATTTATITTTITTTRNATAAASPSKTANTVSTGLQRLLYHAGVYPVSGSVHWTFRSANAGEASTLLLAAHSITGLTGGGSAAAETGASDPITSSGQRIGTIHFTYNTETLTPQTSASSVNPLLMLALPHHAVGLSDLQMLNSQQFDLIYQCIKGPMRPVLGVTWSYDEVLPMFGLEGDVGASKAAHVWDAGARDQLAASLQQDMTLALPIRTENVYGFGKQVARLAQLVHIADVLRQDELNRTSGSTNSTVVPSQFEDIRQQGLDLLFSSLEYFLTSNISDTLVFDGNLGGLVTTDGLRNTEADFGNGRYNDHHFHYGYTLYACAILGQLDPHFIEKYAAHVDTLYYDVAYDRNMESSPSYGIFFPGARHKVWFDGHSFASGLFPFANGKSQESSSEAVNCYYGAYLWSLARHNALEAPESDTSARTDFARLLLASEIRGAQTYWQMSPRPNGQIAAPTAYSQQFSKNYMVGNLGMTDAVCSTWFGTNPIYVHLINFIPVTSMTGELFRRAYVTEEYTQVLGKNAEIEMAWRGYAVANQAIVDPLGAWEAASELFSPQLDSGLSKSEVLYWISTRIGYNGTNLTNKSMIPADRSSDDASMCASNPGCAKLGLTGLCCPAGGGMVLECCSTR